jgi:O-antigen/teichoic acid export membrane protein
MGTNLLMWVPLNFFFVVLSLWVNLEASATLKALSNLVLPLLQANAALASLLLPALAARAGNSEAFRKLLIGSATMLCAGAIVYALLVGAVGKPLLHLMYRGKYDAHAGLLWLLLLIPVLDALIITLASALRSAARPNRVFWAQLSAAGFVLTAGVLASRFYGVNGAGWGMVMGNVVAAVILCGYTLDHLQRKITVHRQADFGREADLGSAQTEGALSCQ